MDHPCSCKDSRDSLTQEKNIPFFMTGVNPRRRTGGVHHPNFDEMETNSSSHLQQNSSLTAEEFQWRIGSSTVHVGVINQRMAHYVDSPRAIPLNPEVLSPGIKCAVTCVQCKQLNQLVHRLPYHLGLSGFVQSFHPRLCGSASPKATLFFLKQPPRVELRGAMSALCRRACPRV